MHTRSLPLVAALLLSAGEVVAQAPAPARQPPLQGRTPAECLQGAADARTRMITQARQAGAAVDAAAIFAEARRLAGDCAARFPVATTAPRDLAALASLYLFAGDTAGARRATDRLLATPGLSPRERGEAYLAAIRSAIAAADPFAGPVAGAETLARQLDALPDSLLDLKLSAHEQLRAQYDYADVDDGLRAHAIAVLDLLALAQRLGVPLPQRTAQSARVQAYLSLARTAADFLHPDSALAVLERAEAECGPDARSAFADPRALYGLVGTRAAPIVAGHWVNAPDTLTTLPLGNGRVTLIQFTAHWCAPCRNSYPGFKRVAARFANTAFDPVFVTGIYGMFEGRRATVEEELAADRTYYGEHWAIPFRVAILVPPAGAAAGAEIALDQAYHVAGVPQIVAVDKRGIIRQIVTGWDHGNEERLGRLIEQLEREP